MLKKILAIALTVITVFSCLAITASADEFERTYEINAKNEITLKAGDSCIGPVEISLLGAIGNSYVFLSSGARNLKVELIQNSMGREIITNLDGKSGNGNTFHVFSEPGTYRLRITNTTKLPQKFDFWIIKASRTYSGFVSYPTAADKVYYEDIDFVNENGTARFINEPDFTGARYEFKDANNACVYALDGSDVKNILGVPVYTGGARVITYTVSVLAFNLKATVTFKASPNPIQNVISTAKTEEAANRTYRFGKDGYIKGTILKYYFCPNVNFEGLTLEIQLKDWAGGGTFTADVEKDEKGCYISVTEYGKQYLRHESKVTENKTMDYLAPVFVGSANFKLTIKIEKAGFFEYLGILIRLFFGVYR